MECEIVIRAATRRDRRERAELVMHAATSYYLHVFNYFSLNLELVLHALVLLAEGLYIFCSARLLPRLAPLWFVVIVWFCVRRLLENVAKQQVACMRTEEVGFVAEYRSRSGANPRAMTVHFVKEQRLWALPAAELGARRLVGAIGVTKRSVHRSGYIHGLAVDSMWRRRGVGGALLRVARMYACRARLTRLEMTICVLQPCARSLLLAHGWESSGMYYEKQRDGGATVPMLRMSHKLPHVYVRPMRRHHAGPLRLV